MTKTAEREQRERTRRRSLFAGTVGLALTALIVLGTPVARVIGPYGLRVLFFRENSHQ